MDFYEKNFIWLNLVLIDKIYLTQRQKIAFDAKKIEIYL